MTQLANQTSRCDSVLKMASMDLDTSVTPLDEAPLIEKCVYRPPPLKMQQIAQSVCSSPKIKEDMRHTKSQGTIDKEGTYR